MDLPDQDRLTPGPTKVALLGTLAVVVVALASFVGGTLDSPRAGLFLALFTALFSARVVGQIAVATTRPRWLPPMQQWNFVPYRILLPVQIALLGLMSAIVVDLARGSGLFATPSATTGAVLVPLSYAYWSAMAARYLLRMARRPGERWFGGTIPIVFHCVLAAFLFVYGSYHASA